MRRYRTRIADVFVQNYSLDRKLLPHILREEPQILREETCTAAVGFTHELRYWRQQILDRRLRCLHGQLFVALADLRVGSPTFRTWQSFHLSDAEQRELLVPAGVACGWQIVSQQARVQTVFSTRPDIHDQRWLRWNDLSLAIPWPSIPEQVAGHDRPSQSLTTLHDQQLPRYDHSASGYDFPARELATAPAQEQRQTPRLPTSNYEPKQPTKAPLRPVVLKPNARPETILLLGCSGPLGQDLHQQLRKLAPVIGACRQPQSARGNPVPMQVDMSRPASVRQAIRMVKPTLIVNTTSCTDVAQAEQTPRMAQAINATAPQVIVEEAERLGCGIIHFCSATVYGGSGQIPWCEQAPTTPQNQVGRTQSVGSQAMLHSRVPHLVLRASWLYSARGVNFVTECIDQLTYRNRLNLASDHWGTPTPTRWLAQLIQQILMIGEPGRLLDKLHEHSGLFHIAPLGYANRIEVADQIMATCRGLGVPVVTGQFKSLRLSELYPGLPIAKNNQLNCTKLTTRFGIDLPRWQTLLSDEIANYVGQTADRPGQPELIDQHVA